MVLPTGSPYGYSLADLYGSPSVPPVGSTYTSSTNQGYPSQIYSMPAPFYEQQQRSPPWSLPPQGQQQYYPSVPAFLEQYDSPNQLPPPTYH